MNFSSGFKQLLFKTLLFSALFIIESGIIGSWLIPTKLLYGYHFFIYGNLGKMVLFSTIAFFLLARKEITSIKKYSYNKGNLLFIVASLFLVPVFFVLANQLLKTSHFSANMLLSLATHMTLIVAPLLLLPGIYGIKFLKDFAKRFKKELLICVGLSVLFYFAIFYVWNLWPYLSNIVMYTVYYLLSLTFSPVIIVEPFTLIVPKFAVSIAQACSGIDSLFLFMSLYTLVLLADFRELNMKKALLFFIPATLGMFILNILRVYILIVGGILIDPETFLKLFHTYLGMIIFIVYFLIIMKFCYPWLKRK